MIGGLEPYKIHRFVVLRVVSMKNVEPSRIKLSGITAKTFPVDGAGLLEQHLLVVIFDAKSLFVGFGR